MTGTTSSLAPWLLAALQDTVGGGAADPLPPAATGYGAQLARTLGALVFVCVAAWWVLRWAARRGALGAPRGRTVRVLERVALDARRSVFLVEVGSKVLLLGAGEQSLSVLAEVPRDELAGAAGEEGAGAGAGERAGGGTVGERFAEVLARIRGAPSAKGERAEAGDGRGAGDDARPPADPGAAG